MNRIAGPHNIAVTRACGNMIPQWQLIEFEGF